MTEHVKLGKQVMLDMYGGQRASEPDELERIILHDIYRRVGEYVAKHVGEDTQQAFARTVGDLRRQSLAHVQSMLSPSPAPSAAYQSVKSSKIRYREKLIVQILQTTTTIVLSQMPVVQWFRKTLLRKPVPFEVLFREASNFAHNGRSVLNAPQLMRRVLDDGWTLADILTNPQLEAYQTPQPDSVGEYLHQLIHLIEHLVTAPSGYAGRDAIFWWLVTGEWNVYGSSLDFGSLVLPRRCAIELILPVGLHPGALADIYRRRALAVMQASKGRAWVKPSTEKVLAEVLDILQDIRRGVTWQQVARRKHVPPSWVKRKVERCLLSLGLHIRADELSIVEGEQNGEASREQ